MTRKKVNDNAVVTKVEVIKMEQSSKYLALIRHHYTDYEFNCEENEQN